MGPPSSLAIPISFPGLSYPVFRGVMKKGYKVPTPIQRKVRGGRADGVGRWGASDLALLSGLSTATPVPAVASVAPLTVQPHKLGHCTGRESWAQHGGHSTLGHFAI